ncbi:MAG: ABC transporter substrate-binding protein [Chloroflexi bacterium]|nr:ABC transporter substrate-binding protein [Chloroflexota bacterium]
MIRGSAAGLAGLGAAALIGCGGGDGGGTASPTAAPPGKTTGAPQATTAPAAKKMGGVLKTSIVGDPPGWGLFQAAGITVGVGSHAYDKLTDVATGPGKDGFSVEVVPSIATAIPEQPDNTTYIFKIRQGVKFHNVAPVNGRAMTVEDVKESIDRLRGHRQWKNDYKAVTEVTAVDATTLRIKTSTPYAPLLNFSSGHYGWRIHPKEIVTADSKGDHEKAPIGTGPFIRTQWSQGSKIVFKKNAEYWNKGKINLDEIQYLVIPDQAAMSAAFRTKQIDLLTVPLGASLNQDLRKAVGKEATEQAANGNSAWISMNHTKPPFNDVRVRQAIGLLYNRNAEVASVHLGDADPYGTALLPHPEALKPKDLPDMFKFMKHDVAEAKKLLAAAGHPNGFKTEIVVCPQYFTNGGYRDSSERIVGDLKLGGVDATIRSIEYGVWIKSVYRPPFNFEGILWGPGRYYSDPDPYVAYWLHPKGIANQSRVNDPAMTALVEKQAIQTNPKERWETLREIQKLEAKNAHYIWRATTRSSQWAQKSVKDYSRHEGYDNREMWHVWKDA